MELKSKEDITIVIFGASGDLTKRKLMPSLYDLYKKNLLPKNVKIVGYARTEMNDQEYHQLLKQFDDYEDPNFFKIVHYYSGSYDQSSDFAEFSTYLAELPPNRLFYLAIPPDLVKTISLNLKEKTVCTSCAEKCKELSRNDEAGWSRIIFEKPFGHDLESAKELDEFLFSQFQEEQILRIDHYLGKETVQNLLAFRFGNNIFEPLWNNRYISHIEINIAEDLAVENRAAYFDQSGLVKDIVQNHALQLLALVTMEPPSSFNAESIRNEKVKLLNSLEIPSPEDVVKNTIRAQYKGYRDTNGVVQDSQTETFTAIKLHIDNWRFGGTPIFIRAGKALAEKRTEVHVHFKPVPHKMFGDHHSFDPNALIFRIQPHEGIHLLFQTKKPGAAFHLTPVEMDFAYKDNYNLDLPDAYERLLLDAMLNDPALFIRHDEVLASWRFIDPILKTWKIEAERIPLKEYIQGTTGPDEMFNFIKEHGFSWSKDFCRLKT